MPGIDSSDTSTEALFKPFSWHSGNPQSRADNLAELSKDIGSGIATVLQLLEFDALESEQERPLFNEQQRGVLLRFTMATASLLSQVAERDIDQRNRKAL